MKKEPVKKYKIQGMEFEFEKPCLKLTQKLEEIYDRYLLHEKEKPEFLSLKREFNSLRNKIFASLNPEDLSKAQRNPEKMFTFIKDKDLKVEVLSTIDEYTLTSLELKKRFLTKGNNLQDILETCLSGDVEKINYDVTDEAFKELMETGADVFNDFFLFMKG